MLTKLRHELLIEASVAAVWAALTDLEAVQAYNPGIERARRVSEQREGVGAARRCDFRMGGSVVERVTEWQAGQAITFAMTDHPWPMTAAQFRIALTPDGGGTRMLQDTEYEFTGDAAGAEAVRSQWEQGIAAVNMAFKQYVEGQPGVMAR
jgi:uncharacterized protein YndB with AHSA1/START domain